MNLTEISITAAIAGVLAIVAGPTLLRTIERSHYTQAYISIGSGLKVGECPKPAGDWVFHCDRVGNAFEIVATSEKGLTLSGVQSPAGKLICKNTLSVSESEILTGCPKFNFTADPR